MSWRLRKPDQTIYGPVELPELRRWAAEGRILPDDVVSENNGDWRPAPDIPDLEMNWILPRAGGVKLGPLHALAYAELLQQRMLRGNEQIQRCDTGETAVVAHLVAAELLSRLAARPDPAPAELALPAPGPEKDDTTGLEKAHQDLARRSERLLARLREQEECIANLTSELNEARAKPSRQIEELEAALRRAQQDAETARQELKALKAEHAALIRDHRDLNERYIRLRDQQPPDAPGGGKPKVRLV